MVILAGCGGNPDLWSLDDGWKRDYSIRNGMTTFVETLSVEGEVPVKGTYGREVKSSMGVMRLAWVDDVLYAAALPNTRFNPPIPILVAQDGKVLRNLSTTVEVNGRREKASVTLTQSTEDILLGRKTVPSVRTFLSIQLKEVAISVTTNYVKGMGPVRQSQSTNGNFDYAMELVGQGS